MELNETLRKIRRDRNLSQDKLADAIGVDATTYGRYEKGESQIKFEHAVKLAQYYAMTLDELYHYPETKEEQEQRFKLQLIEMTGRVKSSDDVLYGIPGRQTVPDKDLRTEIIVRLDGTPDTLRKWINRLSAINAAIE